MHRECIESNPMNCIIINPDISHLYIKGMMGGIHDRTIEIYTGI